MRLCLVSDSHRHRHQLLQVIKSVQPIDAILHAGDETSDAAWLSTQVRWPVIGVSGNWDHPSEDYPAERMITQFGPRIYMAHGHRHGVKAGLAHLGEAAQRQRAQIAVFGHTHQAVSLVMDDMLLINPGSLAEPRRNTERTFALLEAAIIDANNWEVRVSHLTTAGEVNRSLVHVYR
jgi:putative phosphoesterase